MEHYNIRVKGKVQGVFYRANTRTKAEELGLKGWVRNEPGGDVYIEAEGDKDKLDKLVAWCHNGPPHADVSKVDYQSTSHIMGYEDFEVRYR